MNHIVLTIIIGLFGTNVFASDNLEKLSKINVLSKFAFGSCNREYLPQPLWNKVIDHKPQLWVWGGDIIYGDQKPNKDNLELKYLIQKKNKDYSRLIRNTPVIGIWDDHDYGKNNGGTSFLDKYKSQQLLLDFLDEPIISKRRAQEGIYTSYTIGDADKKVKFILLDNRFHLNEDKYNKQVLGDQQWSWLESELKDSDAKIHFIVSGIPILPNKMLHTEEWADYPNEKKKLFTIINKYRPSGVVFMTGDKHFAAFSSKGDYFEVMSSGLTHKTSKVLIPFIKIQFPVSYFGINYSVFDINWKSNPVELKVRIMGISKVAIERTLILKNSKFLLK